MRRSTGSCEAIASASSPSRATVSRKSGRALLINDSINASSSTIRMCFTREILDARARVCQINGVIVGIVQGSKEEPGDIDMRRPTVGLACLILTASVAAQEKVSSDLQALVDTERAFA